MIQTPFYFFLLNPLNPIKYINFTGDNYFFIRKQLNHKMSVSPAPASLPGHTSAAPPTVLFEELSIHPITDPGQRSQLQTRSRRTFTLLFSSCPLALPDGVKGTPTILEHDGYFTKTQRPAAQGGKSRMRLRSRRLPGYVQKRCKIKSNIVTM